MKLETRQKVSHWLPAIFRAFLSFITVFVGPHRAESSFFAFLPMCFVFVGSDIEFAARDS